MGLDGERVRDALRTLTANPAQASLFAEMWPEICSEGTTYDAAYAAAPYLAELAQHAPPDAALDYLVVLGLIETDAGTVPGDLEPAYTQALEESLALALMRLAECPLDHTLRYLLAAVAAFRGRADLASVLQDLDAVSGDCDACGSDVFPDELQAVIRRDQAEGERASR